MSNLLTANPRTIWLFVCAGLALLGIALLVLARLRWTQSRPIATCVVLSVFAHILLIISAYMTNLFERPPVLPGPDVIRVSISMDDRPVLQPREEPQEAKPWERPTSSMAMPPVPATLESQVPELPEPETAAAVDQRLERSDRVPTGVLPLEQPLYPEAPDASELPHPPVTTVAAPMRVDSAAMDEEVTVAEDSSPHAAPWQGIPEAQSPTEGTGDASSEPQMQHLTAPPHTPERSPLVSDMFDHAPSQETTEISPALTDIAESAATSVEAAASVPDIDRAGADDRHWGPSSADQRRQEVDQVHIERRLVSGQPLPEAYRLRVASDRLRLATQRGANTQSEAAVASALVWLASRQSPDGRWDASATGAGRELRVSGQDRARAGMEADTGITGLAVLAFLGAGHTHLDGEHRKVVQRGLEYLLRSQRRDGNMAGAARRYAMMYCHGIATLAVCEGYAMTGDPRMAPYVQRAINYTLSAQDPITGGWRYGPGEPGDTSQFGWQVMALFSAELGGIPIRESNRTAMVRFLHSVSSGRFGGLAAYRPFERGQPTRSMTAEALVCRLFLGGVQNHGALDEAADFILAEPPGSGRGNLYYWYYATLGLSQMDDHRWRTWNQALRQRLLATQRTHEDAIGSWDPDTVWGGHGGRVYSTALATLCLEAYYRYSLAQRSR